MPLCYGGGIDSIGKAIKGGKLFFKLKEKDLAAFILDSKSSPVIRPLAFDICCLWAFTSSW